MGRTFCGHLLWFLAALPSWLLLQIALWFPERAQRQRLKRILKHSAPCDFERMPPRDYETYRPFVERIMRGETTVLTREPPILLEPTGGSTAGPKLIPYTRELKREFQRAIQPWVAGLFLKWPGLMLGRHYWCVTPSTSEEVESAVPVGFDSDAAYLGRIHRWMARWMFAVPPDVAKGRDAETARFHTLVYLLRAPDLRLISVWHPSFLTLLLDTLEKRFDELVAELPPRRAKEVAGVGCEPSALWPRLQVVSCWAGAPCEPWLQRIRNAFPNAHIQAKGIVATEGIASIPLGGREGVAAVRSHFMEFERLDTGRLLPLWRVEEGERYRLVLTTGGGFLRYQTHDLVEVVGRFRRAPRLRFLTRDNVTSDLVGEKITLGEVERIFETLPASVRPAMLAPERTGTRVGYILFVDAEALPAGLCERVEDGLKRNFHYRHARETEQLEPLRMRKVEDLEQKVRNHLVRQGKREGALKPRALHTETGWGAVFELPIPKIGLRR